MLFDFPCKLVDVDVVSPKAFWVVVFASKEDLFDLLFG
jgi:hypothetical protein